jgi:hypothetical protein
VAEGGKDNNLQALSNLSQPTESPVVRWQAGKGHPEWATRDPARSTNDPTTAFAIFEADPTGLGYLQSAAGSAFFGLGNIDPASELYMNPERQLMESFLAVPEYEFPFSNVLGGGQQSASCSETGLPHGQTYTAVGEMCDL